MKFARGRADNVCFSFPGYYDGGEESGGMGMGIDGCLQLSRDVLEVIYQNKCIENDSMID